LLSGYISITPLQLDLTSVKMETWMLEREFEGGIKVA